jgi:hypothetical protein
VSIEALDGFPVSADRISTNAFIGAFFGQQDFNEEFYNGARETGREPRLGQRKNISVLASQTRAGINIVTADTININNFGSIDFTSYDGVPPGFYYAVRVPKEQLQAVIDQTNATNPGHDMLVQAMAFETGVATGNVVPFGAAGIVPVFAEATLTTGDLNGATATLNMARPLARVIGFIGQNLDFSPLYFQEPQDLGRQIRDGIASGAIQNLFMVLRLPTTPRPNKELLTFFDGGTPNNDAPIFGLSYYSFDGATFFRDPNFNYRFSLILSGPVTPPGQQ